MGKISINLPPRHRLEFKITRQRRGLLVPKEPFLPPISKIRNVRNGSKVSRFFRHILEHKRFKRVLGSNLAAFAVLSAVLPGSISTDSLIEIDNPGIIQNVLSEGEIPFKTVPGVHYPVERVKINQGYSVFHAGIDFDGDIGDPIRPIMSGIVEAVQYQRSNFTVEGISSLAYGNAILIRHGNNLTSLYAHLSEIDVVKNQEVTNETVIGKMGSTGFSTGDHLHLEIRQNNFPINPFIILP